MKYKPIRDRCCQNKKCQDYNKFGKGNIIAIQGIKRFKGDSGAISVRPVKKLSVQQRELSTIDSINLAQSLMKWFK